VLGTRKVSVLLWVLVRAWYKSSDCVVVIRSPCLVQEQCLYCSWLWSVRGIRAVAVLLKRGPCVVLDQWMYS
jgi:hypothetical protein